MSDQPEQQPIRVTCPHCGAAAKAPASYVGRKVKCAAEGCRQSFTIAIPETPPPVQTAVADELAGNQFLADQPPERVKQSRWLRTTQASNPGEVPMNPLRWWRHQPLWPALGIGFTVLIFALCLGLSMAGKKASITNKRGGETPLWIFGPAGLLTVGFYTWNSSRKLQSGDANPGVVVSLNPTLIAVATDLTQGGGEFPAVKILRINLTHSGDQPLELGSPVPTVATYAQSPIKDAGHSGDFYPVPAEYATGDQQVIQRLLDSFSPDHYRLVEHALEQLQQPYRPGLYALWEAPGKPIGRRIAKQKDF